MRQDLKDIEPKIEAIGESMLKKRQKIAELAESKAERSEDHRSKDEQLKELRSEVEALKAETDQELEGNKMAMQGRFMSSPIHLEYTRKSTRA